MTNKELSKNLVDKSIEAFLMGLEIYNKPTIKYRVEGFSFFICNAWELLLKATLLDKGISIYYKDSIDRTISLNEAIKKIYTDKHTRIRLNLEKIVELRNISTHFITEDYEAKYAPLFQACVLNFTNELTRFQKRDITKYIPQNFLTISAHYEPLSNDEAKVKYSPEIAQKFIQQANEIDVLKQTYDSDKFAINIKQNLYITKDKSKADFTIKLDQNSENKVEIVKELKDPSNTHKYSYKNVILAVNERLAKKHIKYDYDKLFNSYVLNLFIDFYNIKSNKKYAYKHVIGNQNSFTYSQQLVDFIIGEIKKNPQHIVESLKNKK